jgi:hypothetical protein
MKTTMRFHLTPVRMARKQATAHENVGKKELIYYCWWDCKLGEPLWKSVRRVIKKNRPASFMSFSKNQEIQGHRSSASCSDSPS